MLSKFIGQIKRKAPHFAYPFSKASPKDTIFSISSGGIKSAVAIIRISGPDATKALAFLEKSPSHNDHYNISKEALLKRHKIAPHRTHLKEFYELGAEGGIPEKRLLDKSLMIYFPAPKSFTGEDIIEFHIHGGRALQNKFLSELKKLEGFRIAQGGEFTKRAFFNEKLDLLEVEGLADLINAETESQRAQSIKQFSGESSKLLLTWKNELMKCLAHCEAFIDFESDEEDVQADVYEKTQKKIREVEIQIRRSLEDKNKGEIIREGFKLSIIGPPNAGKSSLLNLLAKRDVAIVSETPGTTRDVLTVSLNLNGYQVIISDTAGLRESTDHIEKEGIKRSLDMANTSNCIILLVDLEELEYKNDTYSLKNLEGDGKFFEKFLEGNEENVLLIVNKSDKFSAVNHPRFENLEEKVFKFGRNILNANAIISCSQEKNIDSLLNEIEKQIKRQLESDSTGNSVLITRARHREELQNCLRHLTAFLNSELPIDLAGEELRCAVNCLGRITGRVDVEEILDILFRDFCIGK